MKKFLGLALVGVFAVTLAGVDNNAEAKKRGCYTNYDDDDDGGRRCRKAKRYDDDDDGGRCCKKNRRRSNCCAPAPCAQRCAPAPCAPRCAPVATCCKATPRCCTSRCNSRCGSRCANRCGSPCGGAVIGTPTPAGKKAPDVPKNGKTPPKPGKKPAA